MSDPASAGPFHRQASLVVINPSGNRSRAVLSPLPFLVGRQADNHLVLRDNRASRHHARFYEEGGEYFIEDLNSRHGVMVNGHRIQSRYRLSGGESIEFGVEDSYKLIFTVEEAELQRLVDQLTQPAGQAGAPTNLSKLRALVEVARSVQSSLSTQSVLGAVVDAALTVTGSQRGFLLMRKDDGLEITVARDHTGRALTGADLQLPIPVILDALRRRKDLLSMRFETGPPLASPGGGPASSFVCVPLVQVQTGGMEETMVMSRGEQIVGVLYLESNPGATDLTAGDRELLQTLAVEASTILENARLLEQERLRVKMEEELKIAHEIQRSLMPRRLPESGWFRAAVASIPSHQVGGDYCDVRQIAPDVWAFVVADVSGKGVSSALLASLLQGAFLAGGHAAARIDELMSQVNQFLTERTEGEKYATVFCGMLHRDGCLHWSNAGHCPPLILRSDGSLEKLEATSMPLGMIDSATFTTERTVLAPGDKIVIYTDGVSEAQNRDGQFYQTKRLEILLRANAGASCGELIQAVIQGVEGFTEGMPQSDDLTAVVLEYACDPDDL